MENTVKKTKAMYFAELRAMVEGWVDREDQDELLEFIDKQVEALEKRKVAAAERAEKKRAESDAMTEAILAQIGDEPITVDEIVVALDSEDASVCHIDTCARAVAVVAVVSDLCALDDQTVLFGKLRSVRVTGSDVVCLFGIQADRTVIEIRPRFAGIVF